MVYCDIYNPTSAAHIFWVGGVRVSIKPGETLKDIDADLAKIPSALIATPKDIPRPFRTGKTPIVVDGMWGIGDNLHQRAVMRKLMEKWDVWLVTCHWLVYHDLVTQGLKLIFKSTRLRAQAKTIEREKGYFLTPPPPPSHAQRIKLWYRKDQIDVHGSILEAMAGTCFVDKKDLDFTLPIPDEWMADADKLIAGMNTGGKPIMIYRPIVLRREWNSANRNPSPDGYAKLFEEARKDYFVISLANLEKDKEWIVGKEERVDAEFHHGELDFPTMAALFKRADMVFCNAGFAPVLAQAVGTPSIIVYGGRESYRTTQRAGAHLAPTCPIDPIHPCDCHIERHDCGDKRINIPAAMSKMRPFIDQVKNRTTASEAPKLAAQPVPSSRVLVFGTAWCDCLDRQKLTEQWMTLHMTLNPDCDFLLVDSASPVPLVSEGYKGPRCEIFDFGDNVGHLSRGGQDGWGRAFTKGLQIAVERGYDWVVHIEGDSLLRVPVAQLLEELRKARKEVGSIPVKGMHRDFTTWVETGLMAFATSYIAQSRFIQLYDWPIRVPRPTPEVIVRNLCGGHLHHWSIKGQRGDRNHITHDNVVSLGLDWVTHCHNDVWVYDRFVEAALGKAPTADPEPVKSQASAPAPSIARSVLPSAAHLKRRGGAFKLNLGCGTNKLEGWENHDADVDVTKPLPWGDATADFIFIEHCIEHVSYHQALGFFREARRVLKPDGVLRVTVPSIEQIMKRGDEDYFKFASKWSKEPTKRGAMRAIVECHGHQFAWTASMLEASLYVAGFDGVQQQELGRSSHSALCGVEGHGRVISDRFNAIESICFEASAHVAASSPPLAIVVGGAECVWDDLGRIKTGMTLRNETWFLVNDMMAEYKTDPGRPVIAVTLHPPKLNDWLAERARNGLPRPDAVWAHRPANELVTNHTEDWAGSSGLFAVKVARQLGFEQIILCGVPMQVEQRHFIRREPWGAAMAFRAGWERHRANIAPYVRSMSGWTKELFGEPDLKKAEQAA